MARPKRKHDLPEEVRSAPKFSQSETLPEIPQSERREIRKAPKRGKVRAVPSVFPNIGQRIKNDGVPSGEQELITCGLLEPT